MKTNIFLLVAGVLLVILGALMKLLHAKVFSIGGGTLLAVGLFFEVLAISLIIRKLVSKT